MYLLLQYIIVVAFVLYSGRLLDAACVMWCKIVLVGPLMNIK